MFKIGDKVVRLPEFKNFGWLSATDKKIDIVLTVKYISKDMIAFEEIEYATSPQYMKHYMSKYIKAVLDYV